jgi:hypothetical protein
VGRALLGRVRARCAIVWWFGVVARTKVKMLEMGGWSVRG